MFTFHDLEIFTCGNNVDLFKVFSSTTALRLTTGFRSDVHVLKLTFSCHTLYTHIYCPPVHQSNVNKIRFPTTVLRAQKGKVFQFSAERSFLLVESRFCHGSPDSISGVYLESHLARVAR